MIQLLTLSIEIKTNIRIKTANQFNDGFYPSKMKKSRLISLHLHSYVTIFLALYFLIEQTDL
jgi:hypothetical protein